jgi:hypothetical protein
MIQNKTQVENVNFRLYFRKSSSDRMKYNTLQHIYIQRSERASVIWAERRIIQAKRNMIKKLVITENGFFSYIYNNVSYIKRIKVERERRDKQKKIKLKCYVNSCSSLPALSPVLRKSLLCLISSASRKARML